MNRLKDGKFEKLYSYTVEDVCNLYQQGIGTMTIAKQYNMSPSNVCAILNKGGITIKHTAQIGVSTDVNFLSYFYGVILGDGHLVKNSKAHQITISSGDLDHVEAIKEFIKHGKILPINNGKSYNFSFSSRNYMDWALSYGCVRGKKSSVIDLPVDLNISLVFLGLMDTDGCWHKPRRGKIKGQYFTVSETMILSLSKYLENLNIKYSITLRKPIKETHKVLNCLSISSESAETFVNHIYKDAYGLPFLIRKFNKVESLMDSTLFAKLKPSGLV